jgi:signal transduction histidine kinase
MKKYTSSLFTSIGLMVFTIIVVLGTVFILMTYLSATHFYQATTQRLNKDVAGHIALFTSPFHDNGFDRKKADSVFYDAMVLSPSIEVYFLDTAGKVMYYHAPDSLIKLHEIPLTNIKQHILSKGMDYIKGPDPKNPGMDQVFSAAEVHSATGLLGYIYVILGSNEYRKVSGSLFDSHVLFLSLRVLLLILLLSLLISLLYLRRIRKSFRRITGVLDQFKKGDYTARLPVNSYNEFSVIADGFNNMANSLVHTIDRLVSAAQERKDFVATISHDLRTPLSIARGYVETLKGEIKKTPADIARQEAFVMMAAKKIHQLESMVGQLFDLSRMDSVEFKPVREPFIISDIIEETLSIAQTQAAEKKISINCRGCQHTYWINADTRMMERLVQNLVDNALKYTNEHGCINVLLERKSTELEITIQNSGPLFSPALIHWINKSHADNMLSFKPHGGLGLTIVIKILQLHNYNYKAWVENEQTNCFSFVMPLYTNK